MCCEDTSLRLTFRRHFLIRFLFSFVTFFIVFILFYAIGYAMATLFHILPQVSNNNYKKQICNHCQIGFCNEQPFEKFNWTLSSKLHIFESLKVNLNLFFCFHFKFHLIRFHAMVF